MARQVIVQWTETAKNQLAKLPPKVRRGLLNKASELRGCTDPRRAHKPLTGPLEGYFRITHGRYRAIYTVVDEKLASGAVVSCIRVLFVAAGQRKERDRKDIYRIAQRLVELGIIPLDDEDSRNPHSD